MAGTNNNGDSEIPEGHFSKYSPQQSFLNKLSLTIQTSGICTTWNPFCRDFEIQSNFIPQKLMICNRIASVIYLKTEMK